MGLHQYFLGLESRPEEGDVGLRELGRAHGQDRGEVVDEVVLGEHDGVCV